MIILTKVIVENRATMVLPQTRQILENFFFSKKKVARKMLVSMNRREILGRTKSD